MSVRRRYLLLAALLALVFSTLLAFKLARPTAPPGPVVATVNGDAILARDVAARLSRLLPALSFHGNVPAERLLRLRRTAVDELVLDALIFNEAEAAGAAALDDGAVGAELASVRARFDNETEYYQALRDSGFTEQEFRATIVRDMVVDKARRDRLAAGPSEADVRAYYEANTTKFRRPERIRLREILIRVDPVGGSQAAREREREAQALLKRLAAGEDFGSLARQHSQDPYRVKDGDLGWVHRGRISALAFEQAAFAAPIGKPRVVRSDSGFHVFVVEAREEERQLTCDEARPLIVERLGQRHSVEADRRWRQALLASARVEILDAALRQAQPLDVAEIPAAGMRPMAPGSRAGALRAH